jgi:hypothetical protein
MSGISFDDLIPGTGESSGISFDDLIPKETETPKEPVAQPIDATGQDAMADAAPASPALMPPAKALEPTAFTPPEPFKQEKEYLGTSTEAGAPVFGPPPSKIGDLDLRADTTKPGETVGSLALKLGKSFWDATQQQVGGAIQSANDLFLDRNVLEAMRETDPEGYAKSKTLVDSIDNKGRQIYAAAQADIEASQPNLAAAPKFVYDIADTSVKMIPTIVATLVTKSPNAGLLGVMGPQVFTQQYGSAKAEGMSPTAATAEAAFYTASETLTELPYLEHLIKVGQKSGFGELIRSMGFEGAGEMVNGALEQTYEAAKAARKNGTSFKEEWEKQGGWNSVLYQGAIGAGAGGAFHVAGQATAPAPGQDVFDEVNNQNFTREGNLAEAARRLDARRFPSVPISPEDHASALPNNLIGEGKAIFAQVLEGHAQPAGGPVAPPPGVPPAVATPPTAGAPGLEDFDNIFEQELGGQPGTTPAAGNESQGAGPEGLPQPARDLSAIPQQIIMQARERPAMVVRASELAPQEVAALEKAGFKPTDGEFYLDELQQEAERRVKAGTWNNSMSIYDNSHLQRQATAAPEPKAPAAPTLRRDGTPFKTEGEARLASNSRTDLKGKGYQVVPVEGGFGLALPQTKSPGETVRAAPAPAPAAVSSSPAAGEISQPSTHTPHTDEGPGTAKNPVAINTAGDMAPIRARIHSAPTDGQKGAGNYALGHGVWNGIPLAFETAKGGVRKSKADAAVPWEVKDHPTDYGYAKTEAIGKDGDKIDVHMGPNPDSKTVFAIDQYDTRTQAFDEHKFMLGFNTQAEAEAAYDKAFTDGKGPARRVDVTPMSVDQFKEWMKSGNTKAPIAVRSSPRVRN